MKRVVWLLIALLALALTACSSGDIAEQIVEGQEGVEDIEIDEDSGEVSIESDDGSMTIGGGEVPDDFPIDLPGGGEVIAVIDAESSVTLSVEYDDSFDTIVNFYENWVEASGLEIQFESSTSDPDVKSWSLAAGEDKFYSITVGEETGSGKISVLISTR